MRLLAAWIFAVIGLAPAAAGAATPRVAGGYYPYDTTVPAVTHIESSTSSCTAVLIAPKRVLTAAHCVDDNLIASDWSVRVGVRDLDDPAQGETRSVTGIVMHPKVSLPESGLHTNHAFYDLAVMFLARPVSTPPAEIGVETDFPDVGTALGWGHYNYDHDHPLYDSRLKAVNLTTGGDEFCDYYINSPEAQHYYSAIHVCAFDYDGVNCITHGDSGGPLVVDSGGVLKVIGITSFFPARYSKGPCGYEAMTGFAWVAGPTLRPWVFSAANPACPGATTRYTRALRASEQRSTRTTRRRYRKAAKAYNEACTGL
jgi:secreted trypsin-like serine protease